MREQDHVEAAVAMNRREAPVAFTVPVVRLRQLTLALRTFRESSSRLALDGSSSPTGSQRAPACEACERSRRRHHACLTYVDLYGCGIVAICAPWILGPV
jgi:hypothetical protein